MKEYVKMCPYCNSLNNRLIFNVKLKRMVSKCEECGYSGSTVFKDVEKPMKIKQRV